MGANQHSRHDEKIAKMSFASVFPHYVAKIEKKGRTLHELYTVIEWLTGYTEPQVNQLINEKVNFKDFFSKAKIHKNAELIKGTICGYKIEEIENELTMQVRYLDKIVEELAKGKSLIKIMR